MIKEITPSYLNKIKDMSSDNKLPGGLYRLEKLIKTNLGVVSVDDSFVSRLINGNVNAYAIYKTKPYIDVFEIHGNKKGIIEIANYFIKKIDTYASYFGYKQLLIKVPLSDKDVLNALKEVGLFNFESRGNNVIAMYPKNVEPKKTFKNFVGTNDKDDNDPYGLFKDKPWSDS